MSNGPPRLRGMTFAVTGLVLSALLILDYGVGLAMLVMFVAVLTRVRTTPGHRSDGPLLDVLIGAGWAAIVCVSAAVAFSAACAPVGAVGFILLACGFSDAASQATILIGLAWVLGFTAAVVTLAHFAEWVLGWI